MSAAAAQNALSKEEAAVFPWRSVAVISVLVLELTLIVPWIHLLFSGPQSPAVGSLLLWLLAYALLARSLTLLADRMRVRSGLAMILSATGLVLGLLLTVNFLVATNALLDLGAAARRVLRAIPMIYPMAPELPIVVLVVLVWRRGAAAASPAILDQTRTSFKFRIGVLIYGLLALIGRHDGAIWGPTLLPLFFLSSLLAMSLARADRLSRLRGAAEPPFSLQWLLSLGGLFGLVVGSGLALGAGLDSVWAYRSLDGLHRLLLRALELSYHLLLPVFIAMEPLLARFLSWLHGLFLSVDAISNPTLEPASPAGDQLGNLDPPPIFDAINRWLASLQPYWPIVRVGLIGLLLALLVFSTIRMIRRRQSSRWDQGLPQDRGEAVRGEPALGRWGRRWRELRDDLRSLGGALLAGQLRTTLVVRRIYARLLSLAAQEGRARYIWETPLEFQAALIRLFPAASEPIKQITSAYLQVRYGETPESEETVVGVRAAWDQIVDIVNT
ncbi:MAG: DUF4129 domain-containing protein [Anaerolineales bacterium]